MDLRKVAIFKGGECIGFKNKPLTLEQHKEENLAALGSYLTGAMKELNIGEHDLTNYANREFNGMSVEKQKRVEEFFAVQLKHESLKEKVKACSTHEELETIAWG